MLSTVQLIVFLLLYFLCSWVCVCLASHGKSAFSNLMSTRIWYSLSDVRFIASPENVTDAIKPSSKALARLVAAPVACDSCEIKRQYQGNSWHKSLLCSYKVVRISNSFKIFAILRNTVITTVLRKFRSTKQNVVCNELGQFWASRRRYHFESPFHALNRYCSSTLSSEYCFEIGYN
jgi:hypothetical protein